MLFQCYTLPITSPYCYWDSCEWPLTKSGGVAVVPFQFVDSSHICKKYKLMQLNCQHPIWISKTHFYIFLQFHWLMLTYLESIIQPPDFVNVVCISMIERDFPRTINFSPWIMDHFEHESTNVQGSCRDLLLRQLNTHQSRIR